MNPIAVVIGFLPFIAFDILSERDFSHAIGWASVVALALTAFFAATGGKNKGSAVLNGASVVIFVVIAGLDFLGGSGVGRWLVTWSAALVAVVLGVFILAMVPIRPFTEEFARQSVPKQYWSSPTFGRVNRVLSTAWGAGLLAIGLLSVVLVALQRADVDLTDGYLDLLLNWVIPIVIYIALVKLTISYPERARGVARAEAESTEALEAGRSA
ncbi:hypothetical protein CLV47_1093 [Antricoccus suffuscus]|uniref:Intracellular septation protein A n=1 Tax=Antricoccus suffuscus TaxID=1629062 RepID=A0A2T0ZYN3_9ACTN|nr:hypothetical protein [Antricoccus suffuscus]PRZ41456.1 hypothetical protein CLV47_1093 [Antricoccus suffuscus]